MLLLVKRHIKVSWITTSLTMVLPQFDVDEANERVIVEHLTFETEKNPFSHKWIKTSARKTLSRYGHQYTYGFIQRRQEREHFHCEIQQINSNRRGNCAEGKFTQ